MQTELTGRGFQIIRFKDANDNACSLQQSSAINDTTIPGASFIWLGIANVKASVMVSDAVKLGLTPKDNEKTGWMPVDLPEEFFIPTRMHLDRSQVKTLVDKLQCWLDTGEFGAANNVTDSSSN